MQTEPILKQPKALALIRKWQAESGNAVSTDYPTPVDWRERRAAKKLARSRRINAETHDRRVMLKIKLKNLADEARLIRREEQLRKGGWLRLELRNHRLGLRQEARATALAYGALRGTPLDRIEVGRKAEDLGPITAGKVLAMLKKYGPKGFVIPDWVATRA